MACFTLRSVGVVKGKKGRGIASAYSALAASLFSTTAAASDAPPTTKGGVEGSGKRDHSELEPVRQVCMRTSALFN